MEILKSVVRINKGHENRNENCHTNAGRDNNSTRRICSEVQNIETGTEMRSQQKIPRINYNRADYYSDIMKKILEKTVYLQFRLVWSEVKRNTRMRDCIFLPNYLTICNISVKRVYISLWKKRKKEQLIFLAFT